MTLEHHVVIGAGPAGLTAAWQLARARRRVTILEADPVSVGGLARTLEFEGYRFDIGPHRFYTKSAAIQEMWRTMLPDDFVHVKRLTRIYYDRKFFSYPIDIGETLRNLGAGRSAKIAASYLRARLAPRRPVRSFEDWAVNAFGHDLYTRFFKTYTEKVWGVPCSEIDRNWAAQRIRGLSLMSAVRHAVFGNRSLAGRTRPKSLVGEFIYPRHGAGQLWETVRDTVLAAGSDGGSDGGSDNACLQGRDVARIHHDGGRVRSVTTRDGETIGGTHFYATMPLREIVSALDPPPPAAVQRAGAALRHRDFIVMHLVVDRADLFPDQWIYVHDPNVRVARITNFANWNTRVDPRGTPLAAEYFCDRDDPTWRLDDDELLEIARKELCTIGLIDADTRVRGRAVRVQNAYPVYDHGYSGNIAGVREWLSSSITNLFPAGRGGLHNYNSQDHAMMSGALSVRNATAGEHHDVWTINTDREYAEEIQTGDETAGIEQRLVPQRRRVAGPE